MEGTTIPRLELQAFVLAAKMVRFLRKELTIPINSVHLFSDSQIVLYWIHSKKQLKTFIHNRVKVIQDVLDELAAAKISSRFYYVNTNANPAGCATRGLTASEINNHIWWHGPQYILDSPSTWPNSKMDFASSLPPKDAEAELKTITSATFENYKSFVSFERTNSYAKLVRVTAYVLKFISKLYISLKNKNKDRHSDKGCVFSQISTASNISTADGISRKRLSSKSIIAKVRPSYKIALYNVFEYERTNMESTVASRGWVRQRQHLWSRTRSCFYRFIL